MLHSWVGVEEAMNAHMRSSPGPWLLSALMVVVLGFTIVGCVSSLLALGDNGSGVAYACSGGNFSPGVGLMDNKSADDRETVYVNIRNFRFHPADIVVPVGTRLVFVNEDDVDHNIMQSGSRRIGVEPPLFESPILSSGQQWSIVLTQPGEYPIVCTVGGHQLMGMVGRIVVTAD